MSLTLTEGGDSVVLPNPEFGDTDDVDFNQTINRNRSGEPMIVYDGTRPILNTSTYLFTRLTSSKKSELRAFLISKAGLEITLTDHEGVVKTGVIVDPRISVITNRDNCSYVVEFSFMEDIS